ncbi:MAG: phosphoribosyltransferase family protein [Cyanobacteria bacterium P01_C01_bin.120]
MTPSKLYDRRQAGRLLAERLMSAQSSETGWVIALPRGGVPVGYEIAQRLQWPLDIWLVRKLGVPDQPELAMGAIAVPDRQILNRALANRLGVTPDQIAGVVQAELQELQRRDRQYRAGRPLPAITQRPVILVDDGVATGATLKAAIAALRKFRPQSITVAVPVAAPQSWRHIRRQADAAVCLITPANMGAISQWYDHFEAVTDTAVVELLTACQLEE